MVFLTFELPGAVRALQFGEEHSAGPGDKKFTLYIQLGDSGHFNVSQYSLGREEGGREGKGRRE